jgi:hypothetical protein
MLTQENTNQMDDFRNGEHSPLLRHMSIDVKEARSFKLSCRHLPARLGALFLILGCLALIFSSQADQNGYIVPIERASEYYIEVDEEIFLWYRIWGNRKSGVPVLFVHGGPGKYVRRFARSLTCVAFPDLSRTMTFDFISR